MVNTVSIPHYNNHEQEDLSLFLEHFVSNINMDNYLQSKLVDNIKFTKDVISLRKAASILSVITMAKILDDPYNMNEFLQGAHIVVHDGGMIYDILDALDHTSERVSSHYPHLKEVSDISMQADGIFNEFLIGKTSEGFTWFQLEAHSTKGLWNTLAHGIDYIYYLLSGKNVSQYGYSVHNDHNPIELSGEAFHLISSIE
jgi:hypothetical protein